MRKYSPIWFIFFFLLISSCTVSFKGISIPPEMSTFYVETFENRAPQAPVDLGQQFSEQLKLKVLNESRLNWDEINPHIEFSGQISRYQVSALAPQPNEIVGFNRLSIAVRVSYINNQDEEENWDNTFSFYQDFSTDVNLLDRQDEFIAAIIRQLVEDIFNQTFTNW